jgi:drug/metabolite transporter (DMT)-like permease
MLQKYIWVGILISFLWGIQTVMHKHLLDHISGLSIMLYSTILYTIMLCITAYCNKLIIVKDFQKINVRVVFILFSIAFFTLFLTNILYYYILNHHESSLVSAIISTSPIFTFIFAYLYLNERVSICRIIGILLFIIGFILIDY